MARKIGVCFYYRVIKVGFSVEFVNHDLGLCYAAKPLFLGS